jgi:hypothetical protein
LVGERVAVHIHSFLQVYSRVELERIAALARKYNVIVIADEVYEWMVYPPTEFIRFGKLKISMRNCMAFSHSARHVRAYDHNWQCWQDVQRDRLEDRLGDCARWPVASVADGQSELFIYMFDGVAGVLICNDF